MSSCFLGNKLSYRDQKQVQDGIAQAILTSQSHYFGQILISQQLHVWCGSQLSRKEHIEKLREVPGFFSKIAINYYFFLILSTFFIDYGFLNL